MALGPPNRSVGELHVLICFGFQKKGYISVGFEGRAQRPQLARLAKRTGSRQASEAERGRGWLTVADCI